MASPEKLTTTEPAQAEFTREQLLVVAKARPEVLVDLVLALQAQMRVLQQEVRELKERLALNSRNSHKPPGSDGLGKPPAPKSLRPKSDRKVGGQPGHPGRTLQQVEKPDRTVVHRMEEKCRCGACEGVSLACGVGVGLREAPGVRAAAAAPGGDRASGGNQALPVLREAGARGIPPEEAAAPAQYGSRFRSLLVYLTQQQLLPVDRTGQICEDLFGQPVSLATVQDASQSAFEAMAGFEAPVVEALRSVPVLHVDESGLRVEGKLQWVHSASTSRLTRYHVHPKRGVKAMAEGGILPHREGWVVHDCWGPYFRSECPSALCNQHLLRELKFLHEEQSQAWAGELMEAMGEFLALSKTERPLSESVIDACHDRYHAALEKGRLLHPRREEGEKRAKQSKACNLLDRLEDYDQCVLAFLSDPQVPFTNNQAEQDIRMVKLKQKISGSFRTAKGAQVFARVRGFFSTARKQGRNLLESITDALNGSPFIPASPA